MQQPNSLHSDFLRHDLLRVYQHRWAFLLIVAVFSAFAVLGLWELDTRRVLSELYVTKELDGEAWQVITACAVLLLFFLVAGLSLRRQRPRRFRVQNFVFWPRIIVNGLAAVVVLLITATVMAASYDYLAESLIPEAVTDAQLKTNRKLLAANVALMVLTFLAGAIAAFWLLRQGFGYLSTYWGHVRLTGYFDREHYQLGDRVVFSLKDRQSLHSEKPYRVHLNYVQELMKKTDGKDNLVRHVAWSTYQDHPAGALHEGIKLELPLNKKVEDYVTDFTFPLPISYWEILVEGEKAHFFARYFLKVGFRPASVNVNDPSTFTA